MSRTHYESTSEIEARIDFYTEKRDRNLLLADYCDRAAASYRLEAAAHSTEGFGPLSTIEGVLSLKVSQAYDEAKKFRSAAEHEDKVTLPKLKTKLAEMQTTPIPGVGEMSVARK